MPAATSDYARLVIGYQHFLMPKAEAAKVFLALNDVELVSYDYNTKGFKPDPRGQGNEGIVQLHAFTVADLAILELNRETTKT
jgi:hypothetical protein